MDNQAGQAPPVKKGKFWKVAFLVLLAIILSVGIYFYILVRKNYANLNNSSANTNRTVTQAIESTDDPYAGSDQAKVVIVEFGDFQCPICYQAFPVVHEIIDHYGSQIKFVYRDFPLSDTHPNAQKAAEAGECAHEQGKFWEMHDKMFINQSDLSVAALKRYAAGIGGLDTVKFNSCLDSGKYTAEVNQDFSDGYFAGVDGTPTFFINGHEFQGATSVVNFESVIDQLLATLK